MQYRVHRGLFVTWLADGEPLRAVDDHDVHARADQRGPGGESGQLLAVVEVEQKIHDTLCEQSCSEQHDVEALGLRTVAHEEPADQRQRDDRSDRG